MTFSKTYDGAEPIRVNKWLGQSGVCSRREAEDLIQQGLISIDGATLTSPGHKIEPGQTLVMLQDAKTKLDAKITIILNKPVGFVSAQPEQNQIPAARLVKKKNLHGDCGLIPDNKTVLAPLGRLDQDSRGLLLLSQDGVLAKAVIGPNSELEKEYLVRVRGEINDDVLQKLRFGLELDGRQLKRAKVAQEESQLLRFVLKEGRKRQIRRMCKAVELDVLDLLRVRIGPVRLQNLPEGMWRPLNTFERVSIVNQRND